MIEKLEWDSNHFNMNIANLSLDSVPGNFDDIEKFVKENKIKLTQCCCDISNSAVINLLEKNGFCFTDLKVTYFLDLKNVNVDISKVLFATAGDIPFLKKIAASAFIDNSRYYNNFFERNKANELFEIWIEKSVHGKFDDMCIKIEQEGIIAGFITGKMVNDLNVRIGLIGVDNNFQGKGVGTGLLKALFHFYKFKGITGIYVSTQGKNIAANNFYIKNGFKIKSVEAWLYKKH